MLSRLFLPHRIAQRKTFLPPLGNGLYKHSGYGSMPRVTKARDLKDTKFDVPNRESYGTIIVLKIVAPNTTASSITELKAQKINKSGSGRSPSNCSLCFFKCFPCHPPTYSSLALAM